MYVMCMACRQSLYINFHEDIMQAIMLDARAKVPARAPTHNRTEATYGRDLASHRSSSSMSRTRIACHAAGRLSFAEAAMT